MNLVHWTIRVLLVAMLACTGVRAQGHEHGHEPDKSTLEMRNDEFFTPQFKHHLTPAPLFGHREGEHSFTTFYDVNLVQVVVVLVLLVLFGLVRASFTSEVGVPGLGWLVRVLRGWCHWLRDEVVYDLMGEEEGRKWAPLFIYMFFFVALMNLAGMLPAAHIGSITIGGVSATACVFVTGALAVVTFTIMLVGGMVQQGPVKFWKSLLPHGLPVVLIPLMAFIEVIGLFVKPFALMVRLFANMLAGHLLIISFVGLIFVFAKMFSLGPLTWATALPTVGMAVFINIIEALVVLLQAYIFTYLSVLFVQQSLHPEH